MLDRFRDLFAVRLPPFGRPRRGDVSIVFYNAMFGTGADLTAPEGFRISDDPSQAATADAVVFHIPTLGALPARKPRGQLWVAWSMESDVNYPRLRDADSMRAFDLRMTYRLDSDVPDLYTGYYADPDNMLRALRTPPRTRDPDDIVSMFISSGINASGRLEYAAELMKHLPVNSYGSALRNARIADDHGRPSKLATIGRHAFDLAFENSVSVDYVTEKFFDPLIVGTIPVYLGAPNVDRFAPGERCFINTADFSGPRELAAYLWHLVENEAEYLSYLEWKQRPFRREFLALLESQREPRNVRLCRAIRARMGGRQ
jgi:hypothetical protein